jgi:hypothetical protein
MKREYKLTETDIKAAIAHYVAETQGAKAIDTKSVIIAVSQREDYYGHITGHEITATVSE